MDAALGDHWRRSESTVNSGIDTEDTLGFMVPRRTVSSCLTRSIFRSTDDLHMEESTEPGVSRDEEAEDGHHTEDLIGLSESERHGIEGHELPVHLCSFLPHRVSKEDPCLLTLTVMRAAVSLLVLW